MNQGQPELKAQKPPQTEAVTDEIITMWTAEQLKLSKRLLIDDSFLGFALPTKQQNAPTEAALGTQNASEGDEKIKSERKCENVSASSNTPLPPVPADVKPCVMPPQASEESTAASLPLLRSVAGIDISFVKDTDLAVASLVVLSFPSLAVVHTTMRHVRMTEPYIPGFLAFREVPLIVPLIEEARSVLAAEMFPQLLFVDGNGVHHPRMFGFASHLGVVCDIPTIGCAKKFLAVDKLTKQMVQNQLLQWHETDRKGPIMPLISPNTKTFWGYAALTGNSTKNPIFVSPGHRIGFATSMALTLAVTPFRVPEPIRQADLLSRAYIRKNFPDAVTADAE